MACQQCMPLPCGAVEGAPPPNPPPPPPPPRPAATNVLPPSVVLKRPPWMPPLSRFHAVRLRSQKPTYSVLGFEGSMRASIAPLQGSFGRLLVSFVQVLPPSIVLKNPRLPIWPQMLPIAAT